MGLLYHYRLCEAASILLKPWGLNFGEMFIHAIRRNCGILAKARVTIFQENNNFLERKEDAVAFHALKPLRYVIL
jgi:hypothetical protein